MMNPRISNVLAVLVAGSLVGACAIDDETDIVDVASVDGKADVATTIHLKRQRTEVRLKAPSLGSYSVSVVAQPLRGQPTTNDKFGRVQISSTFKSDAYLEPEWRGGRGIAPVPYPELICNQAQDKAACIGALQHPAEVLANEFYVAAGEAGTLVFEQKGELSADVEVSIEFTPNRALPNDQDLNGGSQLLVPQTLHEGVTTLKGVIDFPLLGKSVMVNSSNVDVVLFPIDVTAPSTISYDIKSADNVEILDANYRVIKGSSIGDLLVRSLPAGRSWYAIGKFAMGSAPRRAFDASLEIAKTN